MDNEKVFVMSFAKVYPMLIAKAERKGRTREDVLEMTAWLTGYTHEQLEALLNSDTTYGDFFRKAPALNPNRSLIKGSRVSKRNVRDIFCSIFYFPDMSSYAYP